MSVIKSKYLTKQPTFMGRAMYGLTTLILVIFILSVLNRRSIILSGPALAGVIAAGILPILIWAATSPILTKRYIKSRQNKLLDFAAANGFQYSPGHSQEMMDFGLMSLLDMHNSKERAYSNLITATDWTYSDYSYNIYRHTKNGDYKAATVYYGVMTTKLPRALPNVFFDSIKSRKRQFRFQFARSQRHSLEGNFDQHFTTYFPANYIIDSMSFISPDVMQALIAASDYDIEIVGDRIFMYGPLYEPAQQLTDMAAKLAVIKKQLLDNILTYRDERLPFEEGRLGVTLSGASLRPSNFWKIITIAGVAAYVLARILFEIVPRLIK